MLWCDTSLTLTTLSGGIGLVPADEEATHLATTSNWSFFPIYCFLKVKEWLNLAEHSQEINMKCIEMYVW
jgi:hypothetical protein